MAPLPKRKHSTMRKGKRLAELHVALPHVVICKNCHKPKRSHRICAGCGSQL